MFYFYHAIIYICSIISDYDFERLLNTHCSHGDKSFGTLDGAKDECKLNEECTGVFQKNCADDKDYYECLKTSTMSNDAQNEGCFHKKFSVGKNINNNFLHFQYKIRILLFCSQSLALYLFDYNLDPCTKLTCNGLNAECQIYLGGPKKGEPFCACPDGYRGDPQVRCGKHV